MEVYKELSKDGINNVIYIEQSLSEKTVKKYIHSKYYPIKEAEKWADENYQVYKKIYIIFGGGLLYHVRALMKRIDEKSKIIVIEPSMDIYNKLKNEKIIKELQNDSKFNLIVSSSNFDILNYLKKIIRTNNLDIIKSCKLESYEIVFAKEYTEYLKSIKKLFTHRKIDENTSNVFSLDYTENIVNNLFIIQNSDYIMEFKDKFKNKVAIVVSAGPSLIKNIDLLKGNEDKFIIISGGRTLKTLLEKDIIPHFVVSIDPSIANYELFKPVLLSDVPLVCGLVNNKEITHNYKGKKIFYNDFLVPEIDQQILNQKIDGIPGGGSVATYQTSFANYIGCKTIIMIGQDLAYTDNKFHADIASDEENIVKENKNLIKVKGIKTEYVYTSHSLNMYKDWFENYAYLFKDIELINCTEGGAYLEGIIHMDLQDAISKYDNINYDYYSKIKEILYNTTPKIGLNEFYKNLMQMLKSTNNIIELSEKSIELSNRLSRENFDPIILKKLNNIDKNIKKNTKKTMPAALLIKNELVAFEEIAPDNNHDIIKLNLNFYEILNGTYLKFKEIIESAIEVHKI